MSSDLFLAPPQKTIQVNSLEIQGLEPPADNNCVSIGTVLVLGSPGEPSLEELAKQILTETTDFTESSLLKLSHPLSADGWLQGLADGFQGERITAAQSVMQGEDLPFLFLEHVEGSLELVQERFLLQGVQGGRLGGLFYQFPQGQIGLTHHQIRGHGGHGLLEPLYPLNLLNRELAGFDEILDDGFPAQVLLYLGGQAPDFP
jgi:hypothetical protein